MAQPRERARRHGLAGTLAGSSRIGHQPAEVDVELGDRGPRLLPGRELAVVGVRHRGDQGDGRPGVEMGVGAGFKGLRGIWPRRLASEGAVVYPECAMDSNSTSIGSVSGEGGPATRTEGDMRQDHAAYSRRDPPAAATKSRGAGRLRSIREPGPGVIWGTAEPDITTACERPVRPGAIYGTPSPCLLSEPRPRRRANLLIAGQFRPEERPGPRVICGTSAPDITSDDLRPCPGRYAAPGGRISSASRKLRPTPISLFPAGCRASAAFGPDDYAALRRRIISNYPAVHLV